MVVWADAGYAVTDYNDPSFRGDAQHRTMMCNCTSENLEIPGLVLRTILE